MRHIYISVLIMLAACSGNCAYAFGSDTYAESSVLSRGRWVKLSVEQTGMHMISLADLRAWGFDDPSKVRVYGYGGKRIPDQLSLANYNDDLPMVQSETTSRGLVFYAEGPLTRNELSGGDYYYTSNPYSSYGYYFISDRDADARAVPTEGSAPSGEPAATFVENVRHEDDAVSPTQTGHLLVGEDLRFTPTRNFTFNLPGRVADTDVRIRCQVFAKSSGGLQLTFAVNGETVTPSTSDRVAGTEDLGATATMQHSVDMSGESLRLTITASPIGTLSLAYLDYISVCYDRELAMPSARRIEFASTSSTLSLSGGSESTRVWDVTDPLNIMSMNHSVSDGGIAWTNGYYGRRTYAAWDENATFLTPRVVEVVSNQDLHAEPVPDMVIIAHSSLLEQAERVAKLHSEEADSLRVLVVESEKAYNEFGSGCADVNALRRMLKMYYDRGTDASGHHLQYALLMGSVNYDHRKLTDVWRNSTQATLPIWQTDNSTNEDYSYSTDDAYGVIGDNAGLNFASGTMEIAVGRIPAHTADEAKVFVDRLTDYCTSPQNGQWRNRIMLVADDGDDNIHMKDTETMEQNLRSFAKGCDMTYHKVYVDAYDLVGGVVQVAREKFYNLLNDGVVWWNYVGHSSMTSMGGEGLLGLSDINDMYLRRAPFYYGATCSFVHWDGDEYSGLELLTLFESGGLIGGISATRSVYISLNGVLTKALGLELFDTDSQGLMRPIGEVLRRSKNRIGSDSNKLRYVLLGDPAMQLAIPRCLARLDSINGREVIPDDGVSDPVVVTALGNTKLKGSVLSPSGVLLDTFNGYIDITLYDAEHSVTTQGRDSDSEYIYDEQGDQLYTGRATVVNGKWECSMILPPEIADNFRNATLSMYAQSDDGSLSAGGANRDFYVYGYDEDAIVDDVAPVIESMYLNHESFSNGDVVNATPMLLARVSDDIGLNMSLAGIGHQMSLRIDDTLNFNDLSSSFTPDSDGTPAGDIAYQLPELASGNHTATLKVWDIGGNSATASIDFYVDPTQSPKIFDVYTDANPASIEANFYISHNRPDAMLSVKIEIYDMSGRLIWSDSTRGRADMYLTTPVTWDLTNQSGSKVARGIYVYRATVTSDGGDSYSSASSSMAKRIAVAPL